MFIEPIIRFAERLEFYRQRREETVCQKEDLRQIRAYFLPEPGHPVYFKRSENQGFTLIELVLTMTLMTILFSVVAIFMSAPIRSYTDTVRRIALTDAAESALQRMRRDIQRAVPNSIRVKSSGAIQALEMVNVVEGKRYRAQGPANSALDFNTADTDFDVWGNFQYASLTNSSYRIIIYNTGAINGGSFDSPVAGQNIYTTATAPASSVVPPPGTHVITPPGRAITLTNPTATSGHVNIGGGGWQFAFTSPGQRLYLSDGPVSYLCDPTAGTLTRYSGYTISDVQPTSFSGGTSSALVTNSVAGCTFTYVQGAPNRNDLAILRITLTQSGESITLIHQVSVSNVP